VLAVLLEYPLTYKMMLEIDMSNVFIHFGVVSEFYAWGYSWDVEEF
jgi:hypothetical protein